LTSKYLFPSLSTDAWVQNPVKVADYLISHFFLSESSQSTVFKDQVYSFPWLLQRYQGDISQLCRETERSLSTYFSGQFSSVEVQVTEKAIADSINKQGITLYLVFTDQKGTQHNLARLIKYAGLTVNEIIAVINGD